MSNTDNNNNNLKMVREFEELKGMVHRQQDRIEHIETEVGELKHATQAIHDIKESLSAVAIGMGYMKDGIADIKVSQEKMETKMTALSEKVNEVENRPANETRTRVLDVRDRILIGVGSAVMVSAVMALLLIMK